MACALSCISRRTRRIDRPIQLNAAGLQAWLEPVAQVGQQGGDVAGWQVHRIRREGRRFR